MNSSKMRRFALMLLVGAATQVVAAPAPVTELGGSSAQDTSLERLERMIEARNQVQLDMQRQLDQLASEMDELRGIVERNSYDLSQMLERQRELYREVDALSRQPQKEVKEEATAESASSEAYTSNASENEAYEQAVNLIHDGDTILIEKSPHPVHMIQIPDSEYFDVLKGKLSWSGGRA